MREKSYRTVQPIRSKKDREAIGKYLKAKNLRDYTLFEFGTRVGRRISDLCSLDVDDVSYIDERGRLVISERLIVKESKTGKFISLLINEQAQRALRKYLRQRLESVADVQQLLKQPLFSSQKRNSKGEYRLSRWQVWYILSSAARACGLDIRVGTHSLRKTFGYVLYKQGVALELIQKIFNHSSQDVTLSYIGITQDDLDTALREMR